MGAPKKDVIAPIGKITGAIIVLPKVSDNIKSREPRTAELGIRYR